MKMESESEVTQSCLTLSGPIDCSLPGSFVHGISEARVLEWGAIAFSEKDAVENVIKRSSKIGVFKTMSKIKKMTVKYKLHFLEHWVL